MIVALQIPDAFKPAKLLHYIQEKNSWLVYRLGRIMENGYLYRRSHASSRAEASNLKDLHLHTTSTHEPLLVKISK
jgi:hypothetical protein